MTLQIAANRLRERLQRLGEIGRDPSGGVTRLPFSPAQTEAFRVIAQWMREAGLEPGVDEFGILLGTRPGTLDAALLVGSHLDTVPQGGILDGAYGVVAGIEAAQALHEQGVRLRHRLAVLGFPEEEGHAFGVGTLASSALVGDIRRRRLEELHDATGQSAASYLQARAHGLPHAAVPREVVAYLEPHIEQGPVLERSGRSVAAVDAIAGKRGSLVTVSGRAAHAGTTPMDARRDALVAASEVVLAVQSLAAGTGGRAVGTVGLFNVTPNARNVVPGRVVLSLDLRSPDDGLLEILAADVTARAAEIAKRSGVSVSIGPWSRSPGQPLDAQVREVILGAMAASGHEPLTLTSWAGHDAGVLARFIPAGMIFVTSTGGISHAPAESTPWPAAAAGAQVLLETLVALDGSGHTPATMPVAYTATGT